MNLRNILALALFAAIVAASPQINAAPVLKKIVAVSRFDNKTAYSAATIGDGMADQLTDALMQSGQFTVMERENLKDVVGEEDLANSGRVQKSQSAQTGKLVSAQILVQGTITEFENNSSGGSKGFGIGGFHIGSSKSDAQVGLIIRLIDTTTGEVLASQRVEGKAEASGVSWNANSPGMSFGSSDFKKTPMGKAVQEAIDNAVALIADKLKDVPFEAHVIKVNDDGGLLISGGSKAGIAEGDVFTVYSVGENLVDPTTGEQLGAEVTKKGTIKVTKVEEKYAAAKSDTPLTGIKTGDMVRADKS
ncbi:MAG TPA: CsgG/HfaB family protein [Verrucomicrobiae bacterium]